MHQTIRRLRQKIDVHIYNKFYTLSVEKIRVIVPKLSGTQLLLSITIPNGLMTRSSTIRHTISV